ncbi:MAG: 1-deoxy-D-xylulose-5-phosphate synthase, partial [Candidatus Neomarinimicrobiota bacterium]|nr:1-deoxy-D-xylulose-5-phosphate synthase [Candidatus Neomarinimicrobiota bacterium]
EGINNAGHLGCQLLVILNDNEMSISPNVGAISTYFTRLISNPLYNRIRNEIWELTGMIPLGKTKTRNFIRKIDESLKSLIVPGMLFHELGVRYFGPINGHDLDEVIHTLDNIKDIKTPVLLHVVTKKGKGMVSVDNKSGEYHNDALKYHAVKPNGSELPEQVENKIKKESAPIFQNVFGTLACEVARNRQDIVCITAAMKEGTGLSTYAKEFSDRYYDVGIAEGHGVTFSAGLATEGIRPITAIYSTFLQRAYDHIIHDVALQHLPVIFCMDRAGIAGEDGPTHHGALDLAYLRCIQGMIITAPKNGNEFRHLLYTALNITDQPYAIRYPKASSVEFDESGQAELIPVGSWEIEQHGSDIAILAVGIMVYTALEAALQLKSLGISCEVVNCRFIKPMDTSYLESMRKKFTKVITLEEGTIIGGFGDGVTSWLLNRGFNGKLKKLGLPDSFVEHGSRDEILSMLKLDSVGIVESIRELVGARETAER